MAFSHNLSSPEYLEENENVPFNHFKYAAKPREQQGSCLTAVPDKKRQEMQNIMASSHREEALLLGAESSIHP